jgi:hypothetical protein
MEPNWRVLQYRGKQHAEASPRPKVFRRQQAQSTHEYSAIFHSILESRKTITMETEGTINLVREDCSSLVATMKEGGADCFWAQVDGSVTRTISSLAAQWTPAGSDWNYRCVFAMCSDYGQGGAGRLIPGDRCVCSRLFIPARQTPCVRAAITNLRFYFFSILVEQRGRCL